MTVNDFINEYLIWSKGVHAKKTTDANSLVLRAFASYVGDDKPLTDIGTRRVDMFMSQCMHRGLKASSVKRFELKMLLICYLATGRRRKELLALDWLYIDMEARRLIRAESHSN